MTNSTENVTSNSVYDFQWFTEGLLLFLVSCVGLVGNSCSVVTCSRQRVQRVFHRLLLVLATFDALYIISSVLLYAMPMFIESYTLNVKLYILPYILPVIHLALLGSIYSTVALAAERYITICHPFVRYRNRYNGASFIIPVVLFAFFYTLPKFFELRLVDEPVFKSNTTEPVFTEVRLIPTSLRKNKIYIRVYLICMNFVVQILIPFTVLILFNFLTYRTIKESEKTLLQNIRIHYSTRGRRESQSSRAHGVRKQGQSTDEVSPNGSSCTAGGTTRRGSSASARNINFQENGTGPNKATSLRKREVVLSRISIYIVFVFLFCHSVRIVPNAYEMICTYTKDENERLSFPPWVLAFTNLSHLLVTFASSANFYIYFAKYGGRSVFQIKRRSNQSQGNFSQNRRYSRQTNNLLQRQLANSATSHEYAEGIATTRSTTPRLVHATLRQGEGPNSSPDHVISPIIVHNNSVQTVARRHSRCSNDV